MAVSRIVYVLPQMAELAHQFSYAPAARRSEQLARAETLAEELKSAAADGKLGWDYVYVRLTGFVARAQGQGDGAGIAPAALRADLRSLVAFLKSSLDVVAADESDPVLSLNEVTRRFNVSSKTIQRWRKRGLAAEHYIFPDGRRRMGFRQTSLEAFARENAEKIARSLACRPLTIHDRDAIVRRARRIIVRRPCTLKAIGDHIAARMGRSPETVHAVLRRYDQENPTARLFKPAAATALAGATVAARRGAARSGDIADPDALAPVEAIFSAADSVAAGPDRLFRFVHNPLFDHPDAEHIILTELPGAVVAGEARPETPFSREQEIDLFRRMNYLRYRAYRLSLAPPNAPAASDSPPVQNLLVAAHAIKNRLLHANIRLVAQTARRHLRPGMDLMELISDGNVWLMQAVDAFDFSRGARFGTYASYALMKNMARARADRIAGAGGRLVTGQQEVIDGLPARDGREVEQCVDAAALSGRLRAALRTLPERERLLVTAHYGLDTDNMPLSLARLGEQMGVTKARVRQIECRALARLRRKLQGAGELNAVVG